MKKDGVLPEGKWAFDSEVTNCFDDMLSRSIPQYEIMRSVIKDVSSRFISNGSVVIDIGCSHGESIAGLLSDENDVIFFGIDCSEPMVQAAKARFSENKQVNIQDNDLRNGLPRTIPSANLILSVLTIQFVPIEYRQLIVQSVYDKLLPGGVFIFAEKVLGSNHPINTVMVDAYLDMKRKNGYSEDQIQRKKMSLEGVLVPVTASWNEELLKMAGFKTVDCIWRWMNFAAWIAIK